jgi:FkbM family methyltransferase
MNTSTTYSTRSSSLAFTLGYAFAKVAVLWRVRRPRWRFFSFEMEYLWGKVLSVLIQKKFAVRTLEGVDEIETFRGRFHVRPGSHDATIVSPAYESRDFDYLFRLLDELTRNRRSIAFLDVGANIGAFTIPVARRFPADLVEIWSAEPVPANRDLLLRNLNLNGLAEDRVHVLPYALSGSEGVLEMAFSPVAGGDATTIQAGSSHGETLRIPSRRADTVIRATAKVFVAKIDVEGHEFEALSGFTEILASAEQFWLCIEDGNRPDFFERLRAMGFAFVAKRSPGNSWWKFERSARN